MAKPLNIIIAGIWAEWLDWSNCSQLCGTGFQERRRDCSTESLPCTGPDQEENSCNPIPCVTLYSGKYCDIDIPKKFLPGVKIQHNKRNFKNNKTLSKFLRQILQTINFIILTVDTAENNLE